MNHLVLSISGVPIPVPSGVPTGGFDVASTKIIPVLIASSFVFGVLFCLFFVLWAGLDWIMSGGNKEALQKARHKLTFAIIGFLVIMVAFLIVNLIGFSLDIRFFAP